MAPQLLEVFAGKIDYPKYGFFDRDYDTFHHVDD